MLTYRHSNTCHLYNKGSVKEDILCLRHTLYAFCCLKENP